MPVAATAKPSARLDASNLPARAVLPSPFELNRRVNASTLPARAKTLAITIFDHARYGESVCTASDETLGREVGGLTGRQVQRLRNMLEAQGWTETERLGVSKFAYKRIRLGRCCYILPRIDTRGQTPGLHLDIPGRAPRRACLAKSSGSVEPEKETTSRTRGTAESGPDPEPSSSSFASLQGEKIQPLKAKTSQIATATIDAMIAQVLAVLALGRTLAVGKVREWVDRHGLERVKLALTLAEYRKPTRNPVRSEGGIGWILTRWQRMSLEAIREEVSAHQPRSTPARVVMQNCNSRPVEPEPPPPDRAELEAIVAELEGKPRLNVIDRTRLKLARAELAKLDAAGPEPGGRPAP
jgi:hypothetical protein